MRTLDLRRKATEEDVLEFKLLLEEAEKVLMETSILADNFNLLQPIKSRVVGSGVAVKVLKQSILDVCNILEEDPIKKLLDEQERQEGRVYTKEEREPLELVYLSKLDEYDPPEARETRQRIIQRLRKLKDKIGK